MCGIAGIFRRNCESVQAEEIQRMLNTILFRGPDGKGIMILENCGLGHVRLSIQDLTDHGAQPMVSHDERYVLTYNGEVYNVNELRTELSEQGVVFTSVSDTEVLLECLSRYGVEETLARIEGMFAFGLWDKLGKTLVLVRDRHGIKPLYYTIGSGGQICFASEMKVLIGSNPEPDCNTLNAMLIGLGCTGGEHTVFKNIRSVEAGQFIVFRENGTFEKKAFASINDFADASMHEELKMMSSEEIVERVFHDLERSIEMRLISDAPVGAFVSGGIDSSIITTLAARKYPNLKLYHANVLRESEKDAAEDLALHLGLELKCIDISDQDVLELSPMATYHYEHSIMYHRGSCVPFYLVSKIAAKDGMKVILTGEGSDEYFLGYPWCAVKHYVEGYRKLIGHVQNLIHIIPALGKLLWPRQKDNLIEHLRNLVFRYEPKKCYVEIYEKLKFHSNRVERDLCALALEMVASNVRTLLQRNDRLAMAWGLESRFPFLGHSLDRTAINMPSRFKIRKTLKFHDWRHPFICDKWVIRKMAEKYLPRSLSYRSKFGFASLVYYRMQVRKKFFQNGFFANYYGLSERAIEQLVLTSSPNWLAQLVCMEIWGQIFPMGWSVDQSREHLSRYISIKG